MLSLPELLCAALAAVMAAFFYGKKRQNDKHREKAEKEYNNTRKAIDEALETVDDVPADARKWLHERGKS